MWNQNWRDDIWKTIQQLWDIIIIGGGITGAGILREVTRLGLKSLLVEQADFAWGTSSRSSKLVHGGLRYLKEGRIRLTRDSVREREQLLQDGPGLIEPLDFLLATYDGEHPGRLVYSAGLTIYDLLALRWSHHYFSAHDFKLLAGQLSQEGLEGGFRYGDAQTDDARLVLRVLQEAAAAGATAINYVQAKTLLRDENGRVQGVRLYDQEGKQTADVKATIVVNATGAWADDLRPEQEGGKRIRPLRGSHLIFPAWKLPVAQAVSFLHPLDQRPVFILPWEEVTIVGTTDEDHTESLNKEPSITGEEVAYLMAAVEARYPSLGMTLDDILSTYAGVRPVVSSGKSKASEESRDHIIWNEDGLITVTGGKLTTFRVIAEEVIEEVRLQFTGLPPFDMEAPIFDPVDELESMPQNLEAGSVRRLQGRYGANTQYLLDAAEPGELSPINDQTNILWAELRWGARAEGIVHLDDLLLRRVRMGLVLEQGGAEYLEQIRQICQPELGWNDKRWEEEVQAYRRIWEGCYSLPPRSKIPDWQSLLAGKADDEKSVVSKEHALRTPKEVLQISMVVILGSIVSLLAFWFFRRRASD
ncbi:MAG: glycerol-3-phosphate dehydrogenase/oxidase [Candidatus Promineifilaceae bacterium]